MKQAVNLLELPLVDHIKARHIHVRFDCPQCGKPRAWCHQYKDGKPKSLIVVCERCALKYMARLTRDFIKASNSYRKRFFEGAPYLPNKQ